MNSNICAFFDVQGFHNNGLFIPRELALLSDLSTVHFAIDHRQKTSDISLESSWSIATETSMVHGLPFECNGHGLRVNQATSLLSTFYGSSTTQDEFLMAYVSPDAEGVLRRMGIPRIKINLATNPRGKPCQLHPADAKYQCALKTVVQMWHENRTK